ncbi:MAG: formimidoylglutamate deiminase, partial [Polyangiales bacterium]
MTEQGRTEGTAPSVRREGERLVLPGLATAHSHAFQRALRGRTHRPSSHAGSFWSWRALMYELAGKLEPDDVRSLSKLAFAELAMAGVTAVGEFH